MKFEILPLKKPLKRALGELGVDQATEVQARVLPRLLESPTDLVAQAPTGSGKSFAYILPILQRFNSLSKSIQAIILVPTRELAIQVSSQIESLAKYEKVRAVSIYGGAPLVAQMKVLTKLWPQIVVGTPGRVRELVVRKKLCLDRIETVVLDEADEMASQGFVKDLEFILRHCTLTEKKTWMFSATFPKEIKDQIKKYLKNPFKAKAKDDQEEKMIKYQNIEVTKENCYVVLEQLLLDENQAPSFIFCNTRVQVVEVASLLRVKGFAVLPLHGGMEQSEREQSVSQFISGRINIIVCTDVAARGLDIKALESIYNLGLPDDPNLMIHRVGRVGRQGRSGKIYNLIEQKKGASEETP